MGLSSPAEERLTPSNPVEFEKLDAGLRRGEIPDSWRPLFSGADPAILLMMMWAGRLSRRVDAFYQRVLRPYGLRYSDYAVLSMLRFSGPMPPKTLNRYLAITPGGLTKSIDRLEAAKLVGRAPDPDDGRGTLVALTKKGERTVAKVLDSDLEAHERLFRGLTAAKRKRIASALRELLDAFEAPSASRKGS
jgi:DNA-binding MarR family transcriptional regulator